MLDTLERVVFLPGDTADQCLVNVEFCDANGHRQTRTVSLLDAMALARALERVRKEAQEKGWVIMISGERKVLPRPRVRALGIRNTRPVRRPAVSLRRNAPRP